MNSNVTSFISKTIAERSYSLQLIEGVDSDGDGYYCYVLFNKAVFNDIQEQICDGSMDLDKHGIIILKGKGKANEETKKQALEIFNRDYVA